VVVVGKVFGPLHFTRHDLAVLSIMRGRDHGVLDYNSARVACGLPAVTDWSQINPWLDAVNSNVSFNFDCRFLGHGGMATRKKNSRGAKPLHFHHSPSIDVFHFTCLYTFAVSSETLARGSASLLDAAHAQEHNRCRGAGHGPQKFGWVGRSGSALKHEIMLQ